MGPLLRERMVSTDRWAVGRFTCGAGHRRWAEDNVIGPHALIVLPGRPVEIAPAGRRSVVATANVAMFYLPRQPYRRRLIDPRGDDCHHLTLPAPVLRDVLGHHGVDDDGWFPWTRGPVRPEVRLRFERLRRAVATDPVDELGVEEEVLALVSELVGDAAAAWRERVRATSPTTRRHVDQVHLLERTIAARFREDLSLRELAGEVELSPFHAARLFKQHTGQTIAGWRDQLRLRAALAAVERGRRLDDLALELGYASHSHLTDRFRAAFGVPPSALRAGQSRQTKGCTPLHR
ncbi:MAG: helix-turn-helix transcriptional regulator [Alphaproteobacteria bacterium]|nr:helix-turn-helix transcriptional regulator [Alphaproteobacteria bacterium]